MPHPAPSATRRWAGALSLPLLMAALIGATLADPLDDRAPNADQLRQAAGHLPALRLTFLLELLAAALMIAMTMTMVGALRGRGSGIANAGAVLGTLGGVGMSLIAMAHVYLYAIVASGTPDGAAILAARDAAAGAVVPLFFAGPLAVLTFPIAAVRAGLVRWPVLVVMGVFLGLQLVPNLPGGELPSLLAALVAYVWIAGRLLATGELMPARRERWPAATSGVHSSAA